MNSSSGTKPSSLKTFLVEKVFQQHYLKPWWYISQKIILGIVKHDGI